MKVVDNRAVLLNTKNPNKITASIPKSKQVAENKVLVNWGVEETRVLRNLNFNGVPSPIMGQYDWPSRYKPFDHQKTTAAFFTLNPRAFCFNEQGCVDSETEYLSPTGWVKISEYVGGDVAQYTPGGEVEFVTPEEYVKLPCEDMVRIKTQYGVDQLLSPEHRVLLKAAKTNKAKYETLSAEELLGRHDAYHAGYKTPVGGTKQGTKTIAFSAATIPTAFPYNPTTEMPYTDDQLRVLVAVIADGYFGSGTKHCVIRIKKQHKIGRLRLLLNSAGVEYEEKPCLPEGFVKFAFQSPERWEFFGPEFWCASRNQLEIIAHESLQWDGGVTRGQRFYSRNKQSADFIQFAFSATGHTARLLTQHRRGALDYTVQVRNNQDKLFLRGTKPTIYPAKSTDGFKYCFRVPSTYLVFRRNGCVFLSGNTGKTASAIWASDFLIKKGAIKRVLVVCPLSIMDSAWRADLFTFAMHRKVDIAYGVKERRARVIQSDAEYVIINYDGIEVVANEIAAGGFDLIVIDEANHYKNPNTKRWKILSKLISPKTWVWMMTGTPAAQSPVDAFGLAKLINPARVPRYMGAFREQVMYKVTPFKWAPKPSATEVVHNALQPAIRFTKEQCLDLPAMVYVKREVELNKIQKQYYEKLRKHMIMVAAGEEVSAANAAITMNKLLQISCGAVYSDTGEVVEFDIRNRYRVLLEVIEESSKKVLVFVPYKHTIDVLQERLDKDNISTAIIRGDVSASNRTRIFDRFQTSPDPRVLLIQPQSAAHGVTLTAANTVVWWGPTPSLETYAQANARVHRSGQTERCTVVQLQGSYVEKKMYSILDQRIDVHSKMTDLYKEMLEPQI